VIRSIYSVSNIMKLDVFILKLVHIDGFLLIVLNIRFRTLKKIAEDFNRLGIQCLIG
jgi:flagellar biosynthesis GTPase FlhF